MVASFKSNDPLTTVTENKPCLICGWVRKCAISDSGNTLLCANSTAQVGDIVNGYRCKSSSNKSSHCSHTFIKVNKSSQSTVKQSPKPTKPAMSREDRDLWNRKIISTLRLSESDRTHLRNVRGLTDQQIDNWGFRSVGANQSLIGNDWPENLPGYRHDKKNLAISGAGILTPIRQLDQVIAFKVRLTEKKENQRYTCVSDKKYTQYHIDGEQPLAVLVNENNDFSEGSWVSEGNEIKPVIVHHKYNSPVLGGARYWHSSENHAAKFLPLIKEKSEIINLAVDAGDILHAQGIPLKWVKEYKFFESQGFSPRFAWWGQVTKESNDVDELDSLDHIEFINLDQFKELIKEHNPEAYQKIVDDDKPLLTLAVDNSKPSEDPVVTFNQIAIQLLYKELGYKCINGQLAKWEGKYYEIKTDADELKRISDFCNSYPVVAEQKDDKPKVTYPFAKPKIWKEVFECAKTRLHIGSKNFQTTGINCTNGVLTINWEGKKPIINFEDHDPEKHFFTSEPLIEYNPLADSSYCDQLLLCLAPNQRQILLRNLAASLDILTVRKYHGRKIKLLLCIGGGSNGKDSIREVISLIFGGKGMTSFSLDDFIDYDRGIKNSLAGLELSRVNWASESNKTTRLDNSKSLKSFATGDTLIARYLHKDGIPYIPQSVGLFNLNELPNLYGTSQAAMDRFAPITFEKTFVAVDKYDPANKNHMIADPRFKYDPQFIAKAVAPAFLNCLLQELHNLMELGIDYSCTEVKLDQIQKDNNHLFDFCESINLEYRENSVISVSELWQHLEKYYFDQEILSLDTSGNRRWADPVKPSDRYVKGANQVYDRLQAIFPDISSHSMRLNGATKPTKFIKGISIQLNTPKQKNIPTPVYTPVDTPVIPQLYPSYTPVENPANPDTAKVLPSSYTPYTPVSSNYSEKNSKEELDPNFCADPSQTILQNSVFDDGTEENKKSLGQTGVYGVYEAAETLTTTETEGDPNWGITGVYFEETGDKLGYKSEEVVDSSTNIQAVTTDTTPSIKMQLGDFKVGDRTSLEDLTSQIKVVDPREQKQKEFTQEQLAENQIIEDIKSQILGFTSSKDHQDLKNTLDFQDYKALRAIRAWLIKGDMKSDGTRESILPKEFVDIWLN